MKIRSVLVGSITLAGMVLAVGLAAPSFASDSMIITGPSPDGSALITNGEKLGLFDPIGLNDLAIDTGKIYDSKDLVLLGLIAVADNDEINQVLCAPDDGIAIAGSISIEVGMFDIAINQCDDMKTPDGIGLAKTAAVSYKVLPGCIDGIMAGDFKAASGFSAMTGGPSNSRDSAFCATKKVLGALVAANDMISIGMAPATISGGNKVFMDGYWVDDIGLSGAGVMDLGFVGGDTSLNL